MFSTQGSRLKFVRQSLGMTQKDMSEMLEMQSRSYQLYEANSHKIPSNIAITLFEKQNISIDWLLTGSGCMIPTDRLLSIEFIVPTINNIPFVEMAHKEYVEYGQFDAMLSRVNDVVITSSQVQKNVRTKVENVENALKINIEHYRNNKTIPIAAIFQFSAEKHLPFEWLLLGTVGGVKMGTEALDLGIKIFSKTNERYDYLLTLLPYASDVYIKRIENTLEKLKKIQEHDDDFDMLNH